MKNRFVLTVVMLIVCAVSLSGCSAYKSKLDGKYVDKNGDYFIFQKNGDVELSMPAFVPDTSVKGTYKITTKWLLFIIPQKTLYFTYVGEDKVEQWMSAPFKFGSDSSIYINDIEFRLASYDDNGNTKGFVMPWWGWALIIFFGLGIIGNIVDKIKGGE